MNRSRNLALGPPFYHTVARRSSSTVSGGLQVAVCPTLEGYLEPFDQKINFSVRLLLTPGNHHEHVLSLIDGSKEVAAPLPKEHLANVDHLFDHLSMAVQGVPRGMIRPHQEQNRLSKGVHGGPWGSNVTYIS